MKIHREGYLILLLTVILCGSLVWVAFWFIPYAWLRIIIYVGLGILFLFVLQFFRDPVRTPPTREGVIIAPADGKVVVIEETKEQEYLQENRIQISIFMSPLDVHVNRNPVSGQVSYAQYHTGRYLVAWHPKSSTENERHTLAIRTENGSEILMRQIAGAMARRIRCYVKKQDFVTKGEEMGFIKFGSRVDLFLPLHADIQVKLGEQVYAGESILALLD